MTLILKSQMNIIRPDFGAVQPDLQHRATKFWGPKEILMVKPPKYFITYISAAWLNNILRLNFVLVRREVSAW